MAIFRAETKPISRGKGHNAVAAAAYRAGQKLTDKNQFNDDAKIYDYSKKEDVLSADIILPQSLRDAGFTIGRQELWSHVEQHEVTQADNTLKANARVAREWLLALPHELSDDENKALALEFTQRLADDLGVIGDCCIHKPIPKEKKADVNVANKKSNDLHSDPRNIHAHIMFTTRKARLDKDGNLWFAGKSDSELSGQAREKKALPKETDYLKQVREQWANMVNERLAKYGYDLIDHRSYAELELDIKPKVHLGSYLSDLEYSGISTKRGRYNHDIVERNATVFTERTDTLQKLADRADGAADGTKQYLRSGEQRTIATEQAVDRSKQAIIGRNTKVPRPSPYDQQHRASFDRRERAITELAEQTRLFDQISEQSNDNIRDRKPDINHITDAIDALTSETTQIFIFRKNEPGFSDRQKDILERWAIENDLITADFRDNMRLATAFFENAENIQAHLDIVRLIRDPLTEEAKHSEALNSSPQDDLNSLTMNSTNNVSKVSNTANESVSRKYRL